MDFGGHKIFVDVQNYKKEDITILQHKAGQRRTTGTAGDPYQYWVCFGGSLWLNEVVEQLHLLFFPYSNVPASCKATFYHPLKNQPTNLSLYIESNSNDICLVLEYFLSVLFQFKSISYMI